MLEVGCDDMFDCMAQDFFVQDSYRITIIIDFIQFFEQYLSSAGLPCMSLVFIISFSLRRPVMGVSWTRASMPGAMLKENNEDIVLNFQKVDQPVRFR